MPKKKERLYPDMPPRHWWAIRERFKHTISSKLDGDYISTIITGMTSDSAQKNIVPSLRLVGLVEEEGNTNAELAKKWRDDESYPSVCREMVEKVYPKELMETCPYPKTDLAEVKRWFGKQTGTGDSAQSKMAKFYLMLQEADPSKGKEILKTKVEKKVPIKKGKKVAPLKEEITAPKLAETQAIISPTIRLDIQIHISPDATASQIDQIFASMAKHFKLNIKTEND